MAGMGGIDLTGMMGTTPGSPMAGKSSFEHMMQLIGLIRNLENDEQNHALRIQSLTDREERANMAEKLADLRQDQIKAGMLAQVAGLRHGVETTWHPISMAYDTELEKWQKAVQDEYQKRFSNTLDLAKVYGQGSYDAARMAGGAGGASTAANIDEFKKQLSFLADSWLTNNPNAMDKDTANKNIALKIGSPGEFAEIAGKARPGTVATFLQELAANPAAKNEILAKWQNNAASLMATGRVGTGGAAAIDPYQKAMSMLDSLNPNDISPEALYALRNLKQFGGEQGKLNWLEDHAKRMGWKFNRQTGALDLDSMFGPIGMALGQQSGGQGGGGGSIGAGVPAHLGTDQSGASVDLTTPMAFAGTIKDGDSTYAIPTYGASPVDYATIDKMNQGLGGKVLPKDQMDMLSKWAQDVKDAQAAKQAQSIMQQGAAMQQQQGPPTNVDYAIGINKLRPQQPAPIAAPIAPNQTPIGGTSFTQPGMQPRNQQADANFKAFMGKLAELSQSDSGKSWLGSKLRSFGDNPHAAVVDMLTKNGVPPEYEPAVVDFLKKTKNINASPYGVSSIGPDGRPSMPSYDTVAPTPSRTGAFGDPSGPTVNSSGF